MRAIIEAPQTLVLSFFGQEIKRGGTKTFVGVWVITVDMVFLKT